MKDALSCYESLGRQSNDINVDVGIVNCYLQIDQPHTASILVKGLVGKVVRFILTIFESWG
jgi:hypothetical protein